MSDSISESMCTTHVLVRHTPQRVVAKETQTSPKKLHSPLESLPGEIQNLVLQFVYTDYESAFHLSATNKYFRSIVNLAQPGKEAKAAYLEKLQLFPEHHLQRVCFECLTLKPSRFFIQHLPIRCSKSSQCCRCLECYARTKRSNLGHFMRVEGQGVLYCKCGKWTRSLCKQCQNCVLCISDTPAQHTCQTKFMTIPEPHPIDHTFEMINARVAATLMCH